MTTFQSQGPPQLGVSYCSVTCAGHSQKWLGVSKVQAAWTIFSIPASCANTSKPSFKFCGARQHEPLNNAFFVEMGPPCGSATVRIVSFHGMRFPPWCSLEALPWTCLASSGAKQKKSGQVCFTPPSFFGTRDKERARTKTEANEEKAVL